jgi:hypothetical protein
MKTFTAFVCALFVAGSASAQGVYNMAKQQAKRVAGNEAMPSAPQAPPQNVSPQPDPALEATLRNVASLRADFETLGSSPTNAADAQPLVNDLTAAAQGRQPSPASISKLAKDLMAVIAGNNKLRAQPQKLAQYAHAVFNSSHLSPAQQQMVCDAVQKILQDGGAPPDDTANVINDFKTIATETQ